MPRKGTRVHTHAASAARRYHSFARSIYIYIYMYIYIHIYIYYAQVPQLRAEQGWLPLRLGQEHQRPGRRPLSLCLYIISPLSLMGLRPRKRRISLSLSRSLSLSLYIYIYLYIYNNIRAGTLYICIRIPRARQAPCLASHTHRRYLYICI
jgi:hypothetical protein